MSFRRLVLAASPYGLAVLALFFSAIKLMGGSSGKAAWWVVWFAVAVVLLFWMVQTYVGYLQRVYDPTWIIKFDDDWMQSGEQRKAAAKALIEYRGRLSEIEKLKSELEPIDDPLDLLETIGFYVDGSQISPEVAHHHLFHWVRGYWCASRPYLEAWRRKEPTRWEHLPRLYDRTAAIEAKREATQKENLLLNEREVRLFLEEELRLG